MVDVFIRSDPEESELIRITHGQRGSAVENLIAYPVGSKIIIKHIDFQIGGGGTNTAVAFARLGLRTAYLGKIGKDENGLKVFSLLKKEGVAFIGSLGAVNGYSVVLDAMGKDRTILTFKGCNDEFSFEETHQEKLTAKAYYLCSMTGKSLHALEKVAEYAKHHGAHVAFNPSSYLAKLGVDRLRGLLKRTDMLILNDGEARELAGAGTDEELVLRMSRLGPSTVAITKGSQGVVAYHKGIVYHARPPEHLPVVETTGAGDAFGSTLFAAMLLGKPIDEAIRWAMLNAESVISHYGAKNILLARSALERKAGEDKRSISATPAKFASSGPAWAHPTMAKRSTKRMPTIAPLRKEPEAMVKVPAYRPAKKKAIRRVTAPRKSATKKRLVPKRRPAKRATLSPTPKPAKKKAIRKMAAPKKTVVKKVAKKRAVVRKKSPAQRSRSSSRTAKRKKR